MSTSSLNKDFLENRLIPALESGNYKQGVLNLRKNDEHCCLGVICELLVEDGMLERTPRLVEGDKPTMYGYYSQGDSSDTSYSCLPDAAAEYLGITPWGDFSPSSGEISSLSIINDISQDFQPVIDQIKEILSSDDDGYFHPYVEPWKENDNE